LAREQVIGEERICERCGAQVEKRDLEQWFWKITDYADELLDFSKIDWPERIRLAQTNWIGRSEGAEVIFRVADEDMPVDAEVGDGDLVVFTTRPDTLWGATFMVLAPEHPLVDSISKPEVQSELSLYKWNASRQSEIERLSTEKEKSGVFTGAYAINPVNDERIPIWVSDYVLMTYGTGAIMAVPAHDERDFEFASKFNLPIPVVIETKEWVDAGRPLPLPQAYHGEGVMINSGAFDGTPAPSPASEKVTDWLASIGRGEKAVNYRLRDWLISRQRYWGAPIPIIYCDDCGVVAVPYEDLPVLLPDDVNFMPTGESPLKYHDGFLHTTCPECGKAAKRETDTMDTFVCSSWYNYAYLSPYYTDGEVLSSTSKPWDPDEAAYWLPVDTYTGGAEHAVMHLLYTRFFTKALRDAGVLNFNEPMLQLRNQGVILGEPRRGDCVEVVGVWEDSAFRAESITVISFEMIDEWPEAGRSDTRVCGEVMDRDDVSLKVRTSEEGALTVVLVDEDMAVDIPNREGSGTIADVLYHLDVEKMSKSKKNVVAPDALVQNFGADSIRAYLMFGWRWELGGPWDSQGMEGITRWLNRVWNLIVETPREKQKPSPALEKALLKAIHYAIKSVSEDMENFSFNTSIARLMELTNELNRAKPAYWDTDIWDFGVTSLLLLVAPVTPHLAEELWEILDKPYSIHQQSWPVWDEEMLVEEMVEIPIQVNGKVRGRITIAVDSDESAIIDTALADSSVQRFIDGKEVVKVIVPRGRLVSIVVKG
jgi:leucyl-tRNA synthetase